MSARNSNFIVDLPDPAREYLLSFLDARSLSSLCCVCSSWNVAVTLDERAWKSACRKLGLFMEHGERLETAYWKSYALSIIKRLNQMRTSVCFVTSPFEIISRDIKAIYHHNQRLAIAFSNRIEVWHFPTHVLGWTFEMALETCLLKFDDVTLVAGTTIGVLVSWRFGYNRCITMNSGQNSSLNSFDFLTASDIVAGSFLNSNIVLWKLSTGEMVKIIEHTNSMVVKVMLAPRHAEHASRYTILFLFSVDVDSIFVRTVKFDSTDMTMGTLEVHIISIIRLDPPARIPNVYTIIGSLLFDGNCLYYPTSSPMVRSRRICVWDVYDREVVTELHTQDDIKNLLAIGKKYLAIHTTGQNGGDDKLQITKRRSSATEAFCRIPDGILRNREFDNDFFAFGEKSWLNGLDGLNDRGLLFACVVNNERLQTASWTPRFVRAF